MATLVLSTVGNALGGPVGGAIGALIGQSIDQELLGPVRRGPRLNDLNVQTSSYGTQIPRIYGTMRVAGSVIWATDLVESGQTSGAKGQPDVTYSYSVSLAVAVSSRTVAAIKRIWADGKLLRGENGDFKVGTTFRFYDGSENQEIDSLIGSIEGIANTPAYRGLALAVFEDLELADYGNRIPFLTFEIVGDLEAPSVTAVLADASNGLISAGAVQEVGGYAAYGQSIGSSIQPLVDCYAVELFDDGSAIRAASTVAPRSVSDDDLGNSVENEMASRSQREQAAARTLPGVLRLGYYDVDRDFQAGEARASVGERQFNEERRELPGAVNAGDAKSLAQQMLVREWERRDKLTLRLPPRYLDLEPGSRVDLSLNPRSWSVEKCTIDGFVVQAQLRPAPNFGPNLLADAGRIVPSRDQVTGPASIQLLDVPSLSPNSPTLLLAASSASPGWKRSLVEVSVVGQRMAVRTAPRKSLLGRAVTVLPAADPSEIDTTSSVDVLLIDPDQWLASCDDDALAAGANLAIIGGELVQFGDVTPMGGGRFGLTRLLRGRADTQSTVSSHAIGEIFCLVEAGSLQSIQLPIASIGTEVTAEAAGGSSTSLTVQARAGAIAPPAGGTIVDSEARTSIDQILATLRQHGLIST